MRIEDLRIGMEVTVHPGNKNAEDYGVCKVVLIDSNNPTASCRENVAIRTKDGGTFDGFMAKDLLESSHSPTERSTGE